MAAVLRWTGDEDEPVPAPLPSARRHRGRRTPGQALELPPELSSAVWRGTELGSSVTTVLSSGFPALDAELPGAGWPCHSLTEILQPQPAVTEWRLLAPSIRKVVASGLQVVIVGPPKHPHLPGLRFAGLDERHLVWIQAEKPSERLWVTEQLVKANAAGLLVSWLPQTRQEQIRRLQVCAAACDGPVFLCRPAAAEFEPSAAPLRVQVRFGVDWELQVHLLKRKGPTHESDILLPSIPGGLNLILTPRLMKPSLLLAARQLRDTEVPRVVGSPAPRQASVRRVAAH
jgi:protein ImuA